MGAFHSHPHTNPLLLTTNHQTIFTMSGYNNNDAYGTSGTTGGLGSNTTGTNTYGTTNSNFDSDVRRDENYNSSTQGPHKSDMLNKLDPRVDSDGSKAYDNNSSRNDGFASSNTTSGYGSTGRDNDNSRLGSSNIGSTGTSTGAYGSSTGSSGLGSTGTTSGAYGSSTAGPHGSDLANRADPRVDSDNSRFGSSNTGALGSSGTSTGAYGSTGNSGFGSTGQSGYDNSSSNYGSSKTTAGPHSSDLLNKADPRVDSDNSKSYGGSSTHNSAAGFGTTGVTQGPHHTDTANALDPNVDANTGYGNTSTSSSGLGSSGAYGSSNSGPHASNMANKADPRIDSDNDRLRGPDSARDNYGSSGLGSSTTTGTGIGSNAYGSSNTSSGLGSSNTNTYGGSSDTYGSGTTSGAGYGNKSSDHHDNKDGKKDSTMGKLMEKAGDMLGKDNIAEKGRAKREEAARTDNTY